MDTDSIGQFAMVAWFILLPLLIIGPPVWRFFKNRAQTPPAYYELSGPERERVAAAVRQVSLFMEASTLLVDRNMINSSGTAKVGTCMYLVGAMDFLTQHYKLNDKAHFIASYMAMRNFGMSYRQASGMARLIPTFPTTKFGFDTMAEGANGMRQLLAGDEKSNDPMRYFRLVQHWAENPQPGL